ncbi:hypothetical protein L0F63_005092 [Massospora cicadina]|nr:hypothetical protein L0F63_005092 [Massospora cicadina]
MARTAEAHIGPKYCAEGLVMQPIDVTLILQLPRQPCSARLKAKGYSHKLPRGDGNATPHPARFEGFEASLKRIESNL